MVIGGSLEYRRMESITAKKDSKQDSGVEPGG